VDAGFRTPRSDPARRLGFLVGRGRTDHAVDGQARTAKRVGAALVAVSADRQWQIYDYVTHSYQH
jgi:hypothetical protein